MKVLAAVVVIGFGVGAVGARQSQTYAPDDSGFTVKFPGKPKESRATPTTKLGKLKVTTATYADADANVFMISHTDFPNGTGKSENREAMLDGVRDGLKGKEGTVLLDEESRVRGADTAGREFRIRTDSKSVRVIAVVRGDRLFQVGVVGSKNFTESKEASEFLKSFALTKE